MCAHIFAFLHFMFVCVFSSLVTAHSSKRYWLLNNETKCRILPSSLATPPVWLEKWQQFVIDVVQFEPGLVLKKHFCSVFGALLFSRCSLVTIILFCGVHTGCYVG